MLLEQLHAGAFERRQDGPPSIAHRRSQRVSVPMRRRPLAPPDRLPLIKHASRSSCKLAVRQVVALKSNTHKRGRTAASRSRFSAVACEERRVADERQAPAFRGSTTSSFSHGDAGAHREPGTTASSGMASVQHRCRREHGIYPAAAIGIKAAAVRAVKHATGGRRQAVKWRRRSSRLPLGTPTGFALQDVPSTSQPDRASVEPRVTGMSARDSNSPSVQPSTPAPGNCRRTCAQNGRSAHCRIAPADAALPRASSNAEPSA